MFNNMTSSTSGIDMGLFYIVISIIFIVLLLAAIVLWVIDSRMADQRKKTIARKIESGRGLRLESDDLILKVKNGAVEICDDLPVTETAASRVTETERPPVVMTFDDDVSEELGKDGKLEELVSRYGEITDNSVVFESNKNQKITFADKYAALPNEARGRYDEIVSYILAHPDCRKIEASGAVMFKCKTDKLMRAVIKRDVVVLNFMLANTDLNRFVKAGGVKKIKISPVTIRLESADDLALAKQTADITLENLHAEQQYRKERALEARRERRKRKEQTQNV